MVDELDGDGDGVVSLDEARDAYNETETNVNEALEEGDEEDIDESEQALPKDE